MAGLWITGNHLVKAERHFSRFIIKIIIKIKKLTFFISEIEEVLKESGPRQAIAILHIIFDRI